MQKLGWAWSGKVAALCLTVALAGCNSAKTETGNPGTGGASVGGLGAVGGSSQIETSTGAASFGGASSGGLSSTGAPSGGITSAGGNSSGVGNSSSSGGTGAASLGGSTGTGPACITNTDCSSRGDNKKLCSIPTGECVECLVLADCASSATGTGGSTSVSSNNLACVENLCVTYTPCVNSLGCPSNQVCGTTLGHCVQCVSDADCANGAHCGQNLCRINCASDKECTPHGLLCNATLGYCVTCNSNKDCADNRYCSNGECLRDVCVPGATRCQGNAVSTCLADGNGWGTAVACASSRTCAMSNGSAACQPWICTPSATACATTEEKVINCSADGLTATTVTDCASKSQVCVSGACAAVVCTAGQRFCQSNAVRTCSTKGDTSTLYTTCSTSQYCDPASPTCKTLVCTPSQPACNGNVATTCDALGAGYTAGGTDCTAGSSGQVCSAGTCQAQLCTPSTYFCDNASAPSAIKLCASTGLTASTYSTCSSGYYCDASGSSPACKARVCTPGAAACNGNLATTCNSLGSGYVAGGTDCTATSLVCSAGTCKNLVCSPSTYFCDQTKTPNVINYCASDGLSSSSYAICSTTAYCDATTTTSCKTKVCTANQPACNGNVATTCNTQGSGYVTGGTDCTGTALPVCSAGACSNAVVDTIDNSPTTGTTYTSTSAGQVNFYTVTTSRTLTQIELYLGISTSMSLTWAVYEASSQSGTYTRVWTGTTTAATGTGYQSSGAISVPLRAGYYYAIQTTWGTTSPTLYYRSVTFPIAAVSFGTATAASTAATTTITYSTVSYIFFQRLTTTS